MNMPTKISIASALFIISIGAVIIFRPDNKSTQTLGSVTKTLQPYTETDVAKHQSKTDCWTIINENVYDLTSYIPHHKGGDNILSACGVDGTAFFNGQQPGANGDAKRHTGSANADLAKLLIGTLAQ